MNKSILVIILSALSSIVWYLVSKDLPMFQCEPNGFTGCLGVAFTIMFILVLVIPLIFGVFGYIFSSENRFKQAFHFFLISFIISLVVLFSASIANMRQNELKKEQDIQDMKDRYEANPEQYKQRPY